MTSTPSNDIVFDMFTSASLAQNLYIMNSDGSNIRNLTNLTNNSSLAPGDAEWSPSKSQVLFTNASSINEDELYVINANGTSMTDLGVAAINAQWSPDGTKIAYCVGGAYIAVIPSGGGTPVSIGGGEVFGWSPDSTKLLIENSSIYTLNADGSSASPTTIFNGPGGGFTSAVYSPDGTKIAAAYEDGGPYSIWVMNSDGSGAVSITTVSGWEPDWSPDGTKILLTANSGNSVVYVMNPDGSGLVQLSPSGVSSHSACWSPNSANVIFAGGTANGIYNVTASGSVTEDIYNPVGGANSTQLDWAPGH